MSLNKQNKLYVILASTLAVDRKKGLHGLSILSIIKQSGNFNYRELNRIDDCVCDIFPWQTCQIIKLNKASADRRLGGVGWALKPAGQ